MYRARADNVQGRYVYSGGKRLVCIGNAAVSPGDLIWTDGRCVYGHHRTGSTPYIPVQQEDVAAIPILSSSGSYFIYTLDKGLVSLGMGAAHFAVVNQKRHFAFVDDSEVLDAEMDADGNVYTVNAGSYTLLHRKSYDISHYNIRDYRGGITVSATSYPNFSMDPAEADEKGTQSADEYIECSDATLYERGKAGEENNLVEILKNGEVIQRIDLKPLMESGMAEKASSYATEMDNYMADENSSVYPPFRTQPESFPRKLSAKVICAKVGDDGSYCLVVDTAADHIFFPWISYEDPRYSITAHNTQITAGGYSGLIRREHTQSLTKHGGTVKSWAFGVARYKRRLKITPQGVEIIRAEYTASLGDNDVSGGWLIFYSGVNDYDSIVNVNSVTVGDGLELTAHVNQVRVNDDSFKGSWEKTSYGAFVYDEIYEFNSFYLGGDVNYISSSRQLAGHTLFYPTSKEGIFARKVEVAEGKLVLPIQDGFYYVPREEGNAVIYRPDGVKLAEGDFSVEKNISVCKAGNDSYLVGIHGNSLFFCKEGKLTEIADGLGNFRLRPLTDMDSWKKKGE